MLYRSAHYLQSFPWCSEIWSAYVGIAVPGVVGVFLFEVKPAAGESVHPWVWVVVGDVPRAYISAEDAPNPAAALDGYIGAMEEWVDAARRGRGVDDLIPVNVTPTRENADRLASRLDLLERDVLSQYESDLDE